MDDLSFSAKFSTHEVGVVRSTTGIIRCWKLTQDRFDYQTFDSESEAIDFIVAPFPSLTWVVAFEAEFD
jgi:hypothetical protein